MNEAGKLANASLPFCMKCYTVERTVFDKQKTIESEVLHNTVFSTVDLAVEAMRKRADKDIYAMSQVTFPSADSMEVKVADATVRYEVKEHEFDDGKLG